MALQEIIAKLGFQVNDAQLKRASSGLDGLMGKLQTFGALVAGAVVVQGLKNFVNEMVNVGDALGDQATQLGLSVNQLYAYQQATKFAGGETTDFATGFRILSRRANDANEGAKSAKDTFDKLGVTLTDSSGKLKDGITVFREAGLALGKVQNNTERVALAQELFGRSGTKLIGLFASGEKQLDAWLGKQKEFGQDLTGLGEVAGDAADRIQEYEMAMFGLKAILFTTFGPVLNDAILGTAKIVKGIADWIKSIGALRLVLGPLILALSTSAWSTFVGKLVSMGRAIAIPLAKFLLLWLIVDDLITLFQGGDSLIGRFLDKLGGAGWSANFVKETKHILGALAEMVTGFGQTTKDANGFITDNETRFTAFASALASATDQVAKDFSDFFSLVKLDLTMWINDMIQGGKDVGAGFIDGIIEGLKAGAKALFEAVDITVKEIPKVAKKALKSQSPSKEGIELGQNWDSGLVKGILSMQGDVMKATTATLPTAAIRHTSNSVQQTNHIQIPLQQTASANPIGQARTIGRHVATRTRDLLNDAEASLVPTV